MKDNKYIKLVKDNNGITLIALVITIIVLIILAGVSVSLLLGENGLIERTKYAKEQQIIETIREKLELVKSSDYIDKLGNNSIDTYFETLEQEKIEPYTITNKIKMTEIMGNVEVDDKYSYIITIENNNIKVEYEGKVGEITRDPDEILITITGETEQTNLPVTLSANVKANGKDVNSGKYIINTSSEKLGTEESLYTEQITESNINMSLESANTYYIHTLTTDLYGRNQETIKGPITITPNYHEHTGNSLTEGGCYTKPVYKTETYTYQSPQRIYDDDGDGNEDCPQCHRQHDGLGEHGSTTCRYGCTVTSTGTRTVISGYEIACGKSTSTIENYTITY